MRLAEEDQPIFGVGFNAVWRMLYLICEQTFEHENIKSLLNSNEHFDLVITESTFGQESMLVFGHKFNAPTITIQGFVLWSVINRAAGNSLSISSIPDFASTVMWVSDDLHRADQKLHVHHDYPVSVLQRSLAHSPEDCQQVLPW